MTNNIDNEPKKAKNIKHAVIALASIIIAVLLIIIGIFFYGQYKIPKENVKPIDASHITSSF